jgi:ELWxxDGT repeat protein
VHGVELWKCDDGSEAGTIMVKDIVPGSGGSNPWGFIYFNDAIYFGAETPATGRELWKTDGSAAGTVLVKDIYPGNSNGFSYAEQVLNNTIYFRGGDVETGFGLWKSNGTAETTIMVKDIVEGPGSSWVYDLYKVNDIIYFTANDNEHGDELWKTDGTAEGTTIVKDINPGAGSSYPYNFVSHNNKLFFVLNGQLWKSEGGSCNTIPLTNVDDVIVTDYMQPVIINDKLFFVGMTEEHGEELWYYDFSNANTPGCTQTITFEALESQTYGQTPFDLVATASSGLAVTFTSSNPDVATINGSTITINGAGETEITAVQSGDINYSSATPVVYTLTVSKALATLSLEGLSHTYNGVAKSPTVTTMPESLQGVQITYMQNGITVENAVNAGSYNVIVTLQNNNYSAAHVTGTLTIAKAPQTLTLEPAITKTYGDPAFEISAAVSSGLGVTYASSNANVATVNGNVVTIIGAGSATITAAQVGNENYEAAPNKESVLTVNKKTQFITFSSLSEKVVGDPSFTLAATASSGLAVTYSSSNSAVATVSGSTVTIVGAGSTIITAIQAGDNNHETAPSVVQTLTVNKKSQTITFNSLSEVYLGDASFQLTATSSSGLTVTYSSNNPNVATITGNTVTIAGGGEAVITAAQTGNAEYTAANSVEQVLVVKLVTDAEQPFDDVVDVYPNPTSDFVMIETVEFPRTATLRLLNSQGSFVSEPKAIPVSDMIYKVEVTHLTPGVYYLQIIHGATTLTKRIVKK